MFSPAGARSEDAKPPAGTVPDSSKTADAGEKPADPEPQPEYQPKSEPPQEEKDQVQAPNDPCLPPLYRDWSEAAAHNEVTHPGSKFADAKILIDLADFQLILEGILPDGSRKVVYRTEVGVGEPYTPTPEGRFFINHVYCYPDVTFFTGDSGKIPALYNGFFAPLLACDKQGNCRRYREMGIHGFNGSAHPRPKEINVETVGAVSNGCVRLPDPCAFKAALIRLVGVGPIRKDERGSYHWLNQPVEVAITEGEPALVSIVRQGLQFLRSGIEQILTDGVK